MRFFLLKKHYQNQLVAKAQKKYFFYFFCITLIVMHVAIWTVFPSFLRGNLPLDAIEGITWAKHIDFGYDKNPFFYPWIIAFTINYISNAEWAIYFLSQLSVVTCFISIWIIARNILTPVHALLSVILLESIQYYNIHTIDFSDNTLELGIWGLISLFFYKAIENNKWYSWLLFGVFSGIGIVTKYYTVILLTSILLFLLMYKENHKFFKNKFLYLGAICCLLIVLPNIIWLAKHDFSTLIYTASRASTSKSHLYFPAKFLFEQLQNLIIPFILLCCFKRSANFNYNNTHNTYLFFLGVAPLLLTLAVSLFFGLKLRAAWGQPLLSFWGIILIVLMQPQITKSGIIKFSILFSLLGTIVIGLYSSALLHPTKPKTANFPGKEISDKVTKVWHEKYNSSLKYTAGGRWLAGNIAYYSNDKPEVFIDYDKKKNTSVDHDNLKKHGAVFVWDLTKLNRRLEEPYEKVKERYPELLPPEKVQFAWQGNLNLEHAEILVAFLPPTPPSQPSP